MPTSDILQTYYNKIPTWKDPEETGLVPEILITGAPPPPISGGESEIIDFHCAETFDRDGGIVDLEKLAGTIFDDQT